jgi:hypothetical protein
MPLFPRALRPRLTATRHPGAALAAGDVDEMWALRARIFALKHDQAPAADRTKFARIIRTSQRVLRLRDHGGTLRGMMCFLWEELEDHSGVVFTPEYGFFDEGYRGHPMFMIGGLPVLLRVMAEARGRPLWMAGIGYPKSMRSGARLLAPLWSLQDDALPEDARAMLLQVLGTLGGPDADPSRGTAPMPTLPEPAPLPEHQGAFWRRYEALNPKWPDGIGLVMGGRVGIPTVARVLADMGRRRPRTRQTNDAVRPSVDA